MDNNPSILSHVSIGTNDFARAIAFYDAVLPTLGCNRLMEHPGADSFATRVRARLWQKVPRILGGNSLRRATCNGR
ncbi:MAG TPA: hypothetical protein V6C78_34175 [Crinalium sp.]|jgi:catechol 2,3-dioxygenase-like lactoylglutathione lyase family enzyme